MIMPDVALDEASLTRFLDAFYGRVRGDALIGPVFAAAIADADWPRHMETVRAFWSSVLFRSGRYKGNPFGKHLALGRLRPGALRAMARPVRGNSLRPLPRPNLPPS